MELKINTNQLRKFGNNLIKINKITFPEIMNNVMNATTYDITKKLKKEVLPKKFIKRNNFAPMTIRYTKAIGYNMRTMHSIVGQIANAGTNNTKTILEESELGTSVESKSKHTLIGLNNIRSNNSFNKTIKKQNRITNLRPVSARHILRNFRDKDNNNDNSRLELSRIASLIATNRIKTLDKPVIANTKNNKLGIYEIEKEQK